MKTELPELECEGCKARDRIIQLLAESLDAREKVKPFRAPSKTETTGKVVNFTPRESGFDSAA